jgi:hypothetical protein
MAHPVHLAVRRRSYRAAHGRDRSANKDSGYGLPVAFEAASFTGYRRIRQKRALDFRDGLRVVL